MTEIKRRRIATNGIELSILEAGEGPLVLLVHGFPESAYSWRHQLPALAAAGYHAVAPDMRGYGESDLPAEISAYNQWDVSHDILGLVSALGYEQAVVIGHDWGRQQPGIAPCWIRKQCAPLAPCRCRLAPEAQSHHLGC